jgi:hypothetical protein
MFIYLREIFNQKIIIESVNIGKAINGRVQMCPARYIKGVFKGKLLYLPSGGDWSPRVVTDGNNIYSGHFRFSGLET